MPNPEIAEYWKGGKSRPVWRSVNGRERGKSSGIEAPRSPRWGLLSRARSSSIFTSDESSSKSGSAAQSQGVMVTLSATSAPDGSRRIRLPVRISAFLPAPRTAARSVKRLGGGAVRSLRNMVALPRSAVRDSRSTTADSATKTWRPCTAITPPSRRRIPVRRSSEPRAARTMAGPCVATTCPSRSSLRCSQS